MFFNGFAWDLLLRQNKVSSLAKTMVMPVNTELFQNYSPKRAESLKDYVWYNAGSSSYKHNLSTQFGTVWCPCCFYVNCEVSFVAPAPELKLKPAAQTGYVKKNANFVSADDLSIIPVNPMVTPE